MLVARGKAGRLSGMLEKVPAEQKRIHQNDPLAEADAAAGAGAGGETSASPATAATADLTPLLEPVAPPMPPILAEAMDAVPEQQGPTLAAGDTATLVEPEPARRRR